MCGGPERSQSASTQSNSVMEASSAAPDTKDVNHLTDGSENSFSSLLELASDNDVEGFKQSVKQNGSSVDEVGLWYSCRTGSKRVVPTQRTPLMIAASYGSIDVIKYILAHSEVDVNRTCGVDKSTALHCAASGGSVNAVDVVKLLLSAGANPNCIDANGYHPVDVIFDHPKLKSMRISLKELLTGNASACSLSGRKLRVCINSSNFGLPILSSSPENGSPHSPSNLVSSPGASKSNDVPAGSAVEKKEYPFDPSLPDIKNSIYATDEFRIFSFKVRPCSRAYSHDWTECPFVHPGENARRRDPRKFHYSCVPCPDFRKGSCRRGDMCEYAHGVFECWLHPAQYRTRLCKDGTSCNRRVCFFAHTAEELRPLYVSTGSAVPSPRSLASAASVMDMAAAMNLFPGSPSSLAGMSPSPFTQPMSPSANGISHTSAAWPQPNVPMLHLPGSNLQSSRLRSSLNARDMPPEDFNMIPDFDAHQKIFNDLTCLSQTCNSSTSLSSAGRTKTLTPSNLEELFSAEISSSPRYSDQAAAAAVFSPTHKSAILNQFQQQQSMLSPINTSVFSPKNIEHPLLQASFGVGSPGRMSPRSVEPISPMGTRLSAFAQREKQHHQQLRSLSSRDLGSNNPVSVVGSPGNSWSRWESPNGKLDWSVKGDELGGLRRSSSFELGNNGEEPDLSWIQSLVKESPPERMKESAIPVSGATSSVGMSANSQIDSLDHSVIGAWLEQMQLDQLVV